MDRVVAKQGAIGRENVHKPAVRLVLGNKRHPNLSVDRLNAVGELCPLCYENLMVAIAEVMSKPNQVSAARLVQADAGALIDGPGAGGAN
jgi:hypothetical protein